MESMDRVLCMARPSSAKRSCAGRHASDQLSDYADEQRGRNVSTRIIEKFIPNVRSTQEASQEDSKIRRNGQPGSVRPWTMEHETTQPRELEPGGNQIGNFLRLGSDVLRQADDRRPATD